MGGKGFGSGCPFYNRIEFVNFVNHRDSFALVCVLAWLHYPDVPRFLFAPISFLLFLLLLFDDRLSSVVIGDEPLVLQVFKAFFDVESQGDVLKSIISNQFVVLAQIVEEGLFVAQVKVVL